MLGCMHVLLLAAATTQLLNVRGHAAPKCTAEKGQPTTAELIGQHAKLLIDTRGRYREPARHIVNA